MHSFSEAELQVCPQKVSSVPHRLRGCRDYGLLQEPGQPSLGGFAEAYLLTLSLAVGIYPTPVLGPGSRLPVHPLSAAAEKVWSSRPSCIHHKV